MSGKQEEGTEADPRWRTPPRTAVDVAHAAFAVPELETSSVSLKRQRVDARHGDEVIPVADPEIPADAVKMTNGAAGAARMKSHFASVGESRPGYDCAMEARLRVIGSLAHVGNPGRVAIGVQESRMRVMAGLMMRVRHGEAFGEEAIAGPSQTFIPRNPDGGLRGPRETAADELRMASMKRFGPIEALYRNAVSDSEGATRCIMNVQTRRLMHNLLHLAEYGLSVDAARSLRKVIAEGGDSKGALVEQLSKDASESVGTFNEVRVNKGVTKKAQVSAYAGSALSVAAIRRAREEGLALVEEVVVVDDGHGASAAGSVGPSMSEGDPPSLVDDPFSSVTLDLPVSPSVGRGVGGIDGQKRFRYHLEQDRRAIIRLRQLSAPQSIPVQGSVNVPEIETITRGYAHTYLRAAIQELGERGCRNGDGAETGIPCVFAMRGDRYMIECGYTAAVKMADIEEACAHHVSAKNSTGASRFEGAVSINAAKGSMAASGASAAAGDVVLSNVEAGSAMDQIGRIAGAASARDAPVSYKPKSVRASSRKNAPTKKRSKKKKKKKKGSDADPPTVQELMESGRAKTHADAIKMIVAESAPVNTRTVETTPDSVYRGTASLFDLEGASFVCREFLTPVQAMAYKDGKRTQEPGLCIGCIRRMCATLAMVCRESGHRPDVPLQNHANMVGGTEGYPPCMMIDFGGGSGSGDPGADILEPEFMRRPMVGWWPDTYKMRTVIVKITKTLSDGTTKAMDVHVVGREEQILHFSEGPRAGVVLDYGSPFSHAARMIEVIGCPAVAPMFPSRHDCGDEPVAVETKEGQYEFRYLSARDLSRRLSGKPLRVTRPGAMDATASRARTRIAGSMSRTAASAAVGPAFGRASRLFDAKSRARNPKRPADDIDASTEDANSEVAKAVQWVVMADDDYALMAPRSVEMRQSADDAHYSATSIVGIKMSTPLDHPSNTTPNAPTHPWAAAAASGRGYCPPNASVDDEDGSMDMNDYTGFSRDEARPVVQPPVAFRRRDFSVSDTAGNDPDRPFAGPGGFMQRGAYPEMGRAPPPIASDAGECLEHFVSRSVGGEVSCDDAHDRYVNTPSKADKSSSDPLNIRFARVSRERPPPPRSPRLSIGPFFKRAVRHKWLCVFSRCLYRTRVCDAMDIVAAYARTRASRTRVFRQGMPVYGVPAKVARAALRFPRRYGVLWRIMARVHLAEMLSAELAGDEVRGTVHLFLAGEKRIVSELLDGDPRAVDSMWRLHSEKRCAAAAAAHFAETHAPIMEAMRSVGFYTDAAITSVTMPLLSELHGDPTGVDDGVPTDCILSSFYPHDGHVAVPGDLPDITQVKPSVQMSQTGDIEPVGNDKRLSMIQSDTVKCTWPMPKNDATATDAAASENPKARKGNAAAAASDASAERPRLRDGLHVQPQKRIGRKGRTRYATLGSKTETLSKNDRGSERLRRECTGDSKLYLALSALMRRLPPHNYKTPRLVRMIVDYMDTFQSIALLARWVLLLSLKRGYGHADPTHRPGFHERARIVWMFRTVSMSHMDITDFALAYPERFACAWREYAVYLNDCGSETRRGALLTLTDHAHICGSVRSAADMTGAFLTTWMEDALCATAGKPLPDDDGSPKWVDDREIVERFMGDNGALNKLVVESHEATEAMILGSYQRIEGNALNFDGRSPLFVLREDAIAIYREYVSRSAVPETQSPEILLAYRMGIDKASNAIKLATRMLRVVGRGEGGRVLPRFDVLGVLGASKETVDAVTEGMGHYAFFSTSHKYIKKLAKSIVKRDPFDLARLVVFCNIACLMGQDGVVRITCAGQARLQVETARTKFSFQDDVSPGMISVPFCMDCREVRGALYSPTMNMKPIPGIEKTMGAHNTTTHLNETYPEDMEDDDASESVPFTSCAGKRRTQPKMNQSRWYRPADVGSVVHDIDSDNIFLGPRSNTFNFKKTQADVAHDLDPEHKDTRPPDDEMDAFLEYMTMDEMDTTGDCSFLPIRRYVAIGAVVGIAGGFYSVCPNCLIVHPFNGRACSRESITCTLHSMSSDTLLAGKSEQGVIPYDAKRARMETMYGKWTGCSVCTRTLFSRLSITPTFLVADTLSCSMVRDTVKAGGTRSYRDANREYRRSPIVQDGSFDISRETICNRDAKSLIDATVQNKSDFARRAMANSERAMRKYGAVE